MKKAWCIIIFVLAFIKIQAQFGFCASGSSLNLVCNPGFEYYISCPQYLSEMNQAYGWYEAGPDPDFYHASTANTIVSIPQNIYGYQYPHSGNGMAGMGTFFREFPPSATYSGESIGTKLIDTLEIGQKYYLSMYVSFAEMLKGYQKIATNKTGMRFATKRPGGWAGPPPLNNFDHLHTNLIITDTLNWYRISGSFIADSAYSHLILGNFFDYLNVDSILVGTPIKYGRSWSYYYVDDVCVSKDSLTCSSMVGIRENQGHEHNFKIYPNPTESEISIETVQEGKYEFEVYNILGEAVLTRRIDFLKTKMDVSILNNGIYLYLIKENGSVLKSDKLIIAR